MKLRNLLLPIVLCLGINTAVDAQTVPETQMPIITKIAATWCGNCGTWGWNLFEGLLEDNEGKAIFLNTHYSGDLISAASSALSSNLNANGQPKFYYNNDNTSASANSVAAKRVEIAGMVDATNLEAPIANTGLEFDYDGYAFNIKTKTKFFSEMTGNIHLGIIALESKVVNNQASLGVVEHTYIVRGAESGNTFGPMIASGTIDAGTEIEGTYTFTREASWNADNITLVALMWSEENDNFTYINGSYGVEAMPSSLNVDLGGAFNAQWRSNDSENELFIQTSTDLGTTDINVYNVNGQLVKQLFQGELNQGEYHLPVENLNSGNYFIEINSEKGKETLKAQF